MAKGRQAALSFIFITILIDCTGLGVIIPVTPKLIEQLVGGDLSTASQYGGWLMFSYAIMQFIFSPVLGGLSDRFGRRPILLMSLLGIGVDYIFMALAPTIAWLFVGRVFSGLFGASFTTASAYIADVSEPEKRAQNFGMIGAAFGLGFIIGPVLGAVFSKFAITIPFAHISLAASRTPFVVAAVLSLCNWLYGYFILPESLSKEHRRAFDLKRANPVGSLLNLKRYPAVLGLITSIFFIYIAAHATQSTWTYYTMKKFSWQEDMVGYSLGFVGLMFAIVQGGLIRVINPKLGNKNSVFIGLALYVIGFLCFAFANEGWMMFVFLIPYALGGIAGPAIQGIISNQVPPNEQGELQGTLTSIMSVTSILGPVIMTSLFAYCTKANTPLYFPGAPFMLGAILMFISLGLTIKPLNAYHKAK